MNHILVDTFLSLTTERKVFSILGVLLTLTMAAFCIHDLLYTRYASTFKKRELVRTTKHSDKNFFDNVTEIHNSL